MFTLSTSKANEAAAVQPGQISYLGQWEEKRSRIRGGRIKTIGFIETHRLIRKRVNQKRLDANNLGYLNCTQNGIAQECFAKAATLPSEINRQAA